MSEKTKEVAENPENNEENTQNQEILSSKSKLKESQREKLRNKKALTPSVKIRMFKTIFNIGFFTHVIGISVAVICTLLNVFDPLNFYLELAWYFQILGGIFYLSLWIILFRTIKKIALNINT